MPVSARSSPEFAFDEKIEHDRIFGRARDDSGRLRAYKVTLKGIALCKSGNLEQHFAQMSCDAVLYRVSY